MRRSGRTRVPLHYARNFKLLESVECSDPRLPSDVLNDLNYDMHVIDHFQDLPVTGAVLLPGPDGHWTGSLTGFCDPQETCHVMETLTGHGAYESLFATILGGDAEAGAENRYEGKIFEGEMPPMPEPAAAVRRADDPRHQRVSRRGRSCAGCGPQERPWWCAWRSAGCRRWRKTR